MEFPGDDQISRNPRRIFHTFYAFLTTNRFTAQIKKRTNRKKLNQPIFFYQIKLEIKALNNLLYQLISQWKLLHESNFSKGFSRVNST